MTGSEHPDAIRLDWLQSRGEMSGGSPWICRPSTMPSLYGDRGGGWRLHQGTQRLIQELVSRDGREDLRDAIDDAIRAEGDQETLAAIDAAGEMLLVDIEAGG